MTSTIVPPVDLAPGMPSRVVTISATDVTEGGKSLEGQMVRFALSDTLDVSSGGDVIAKTQAEVVLDANGEGRIRLPVYDEDVRTWCGQDWAILVTATWGSQKAIRVPAGSSSVALSALPPVRPLRGREKQWAVTGASVSVTEGAQWDIDVSLSGGVLDFDFIVPPGGVAWHRGALTASTDLYGLDPGVYHIGNGTLAASLGLPVARAGSVEVLQASSLAKVITFRTNYVAESLPQEVWTRASTGTGEWNDEWRKTPTQDDLWRKRLILAGEDLADLPPGVYYTSGNHPDLPVVSQGVYEVMQYSSVGIAHRFTTNDHSASNPGSEIWLRTNSGHGVWDRPWQKIYPTDNSSPGYDIIILAGQSNMSGGGYPIPDHELGSMIYQYPAIEQTGAGTIIPAKEPLRHQEQGGRGGAGPGGYFGVEWAKNHPGRKVLLVPAARSGSAFTSTSLDPAPEGYYTAPSGTWDRHLTADPKNYALNMLDQVEDAIAAAGPGSRVVAFAWVQGEGDGGNLTETEYIAKAVDLFGQVRAVSGEPDLPLVIGQMSPDNLVSEGRKAINRAHIRLPGELTRAAFSYAPVGLSNHNDPTHLGTRAQEIIGARFFDAYRRAVKNLAGEPPVAVEDLDAYSDGVTVHLSWTWPACRVESYLIEWTTDGTTWQTAGAQQMSDLDCAATITGPGAAARRVRVSVVNAEGTSLPLEARVTAVVAA